MTKLSEEETEAEKKNPAQIKDQANVLFWLIEQGL